MMNIYYENSKGDRLRLNGPKYYLLNDTDLVNYEWGFESNHNRIINLKREIMKKKCKIVVKSSTLSEDVKHIFELLEYDVAKKQPGRLYVGDYYIECYFYLSTKKTEYTKDKTAYIEFGVVTKDNFGWRKDKTLLHRNQESGGKDYNSKYDYDYVSDIRPYVSNTGYVPQDFRLKVYGPAERVDVTIGPNRYFVYAVVEEGSHLVIDSIDKTVLMYNVDGVENVFNMRDKDTNIFEKIPVGQNKLIVTSGTDVEVTLIDQRSEPLWI